MKRAAVVCLLVFASAPVFAQPPKQPVTMADFEALAARVAKLESGAVTPADLVGTYRLFSFGMELHGNPADIGNEIADATLTFRANGTGTFNWTDYRADLHQGAPWFMTHAVNPLTGEFEWTLTPDGVAVGNLLANVSAGGRIIFWGGQSQDVNGSWSQLAIGVKLP
jgi:hypothetical protein